VLLGIIMTLIAMWSGYKRAKAVGRRRPVPWAALTGIVFLGTQVVFSVGIAAGILIPSRLLGWREGIYSENITLINAICMVAGLVSLLGVFYFMDKGARKPAEDQAGLPPPPPPTFDKNI
jgi:MFS family permease